MRVPLRRVFPVLCLALAVACGGGSGEPGKSSDPGSGAGTPPPGQGTPSQPASPSDPGSSGGSATPTDPGTPAGSTTPPGGGSGGSTTPPGSGTSGGSGGAGGSTTPPGGSSGGPSTPPPAGSPYVVRVDCSPVNDFGYIGWAKGDLPIGARTPDGALAVSGTLKVRYKFIDGAETDEDVKVEGTVDTGGQYVSAKVVSGSSTLASVYLVFQADSPFSALNSPNGGPAYQTRCGASTAVVPHGSDLRPDGALRFLERSDGSLDVHVAVVNVGDQPTSGATGRARIATFTASAELHHATDAAGAAPGKLGAGERGYLALVLPKGALARCTEPQVTLDLDHTLQSGAPDPFANDTAKASTPCMTWSRPISADALGFDPDPFLVGKTLGGIVGSTEVGRTDGKLCSSCHYSGSGNKYSPPVQAGASGPIAPTDTIGGTTWAAQGGLASRFLTNPIGKPDYLKAIVKRWLDDGARP